MNQQDCPDLTGWATEIRSDADPEQLPDELLGVITEGINAHPRSQQKEIGPSEIGHPCNRWLAHFFAGTPRRQRSVPWRPAVGTAVHTDLSVWLHRWNETHGTRWLTDIKVWVGDLYEGRPIVGHLDALDLWTATVVDFKIPGPGQMKTHRSAAGGPEQQPSYRTQKHLYAKGCVNAGFPVRQVAILRLPAAGELDDAIWTVEPYQPALAETALVRAGGIARMVDTLGVEAIPLQPTSENYCAGCPFFEPHTTDLHTGCPGDQAFITKRDNRRSTLLDLIA